MVEDVIPNSLMREVVRTGEPIMLDIMQFGDESFFQRVSAAVIMDDFPRSTAGKTLKREMRAPYWKNQGRSI